MKQVLLTLEEATNAYWGYKMDRVGITPLKEAERRRRVAKIQLKRVVDMLQKCDGDLVSRDNKPFMATFEMLAEDWEALLKEIE